MGFGIMRDKNPEMGVGERKKFVMRPPQVVRVGSKKTAFANFMEIAKMLHRTPKHLLQFLFAELGTSGAIDGNNQLIIKGRFQQKHIENVLRRYIKEYVTCHTCRSPDTILNKETRLFFLQCMTCHSSCSVQTIKTGFQVILCHIYPVHQTSISSLLTSIHSFSGCHRQEKVTPSENHLDRHLDSLDHHPGHPGSALPSPSISLFNQLGLWNQLRTTPCWQITLALFSQNQ